MMHRYIEKLYYNVLVLKRKLQHKDKNIILVSSNDTWCEYTLDLKTMKTDFEWED